MIPDELRPLLQEAIDRAGGMYTLESIEEAVNACRMQLWFSTDKSAVVVTQVGTYPETKVLWVLLAAGTLDGIMSIQERGRRWAKGHGISRMVMDGRMGWDRVLPRYGWEKHCIRYSLKV